MLLSALLEVNKRNVCLCEVQDTSGCNCVFASAVCVCVCVVCGGREEKKNTGKVCVCSQWDTVGESVLVELAWTGGGLRPVPGR